MIILCLQLGSNDFENEELNWKYKDQKVNEIFWSLDFKINNILSSPKQKFVIKFPKIESSPMMTCQKLYAKHFDRYEKQDETKMFGQINHFKFLDQEVTKKNVSLEQQVAKLEANFDKA